MSEKRNLPSTSIIYAFQNYCSATPLCNHLNKENKV